MGRQANPKGLDLGLALDYPGRAFSRSGGKFASLAAGHRAGDRVGPERSHADRRSTSTLTASSRVGIYPPRSRRGQDHDGACPDERQARYDIDLAQVHAMRRQIGEAL